jgi:LysR family transcriptional regulator, regulator for genes of the gallate degradation pathway
MSATPFEFNLRHLQGLLAVRDHGSVSSAASVVNLSQPALTQAIVKLETQFGYALFERRADGMSITSIGEQIAQRVGAALTHLGEGAQSLAGGMPRPERRLTMTQLRAFLALADAGSFAGAAHVEGLSRTAVHRAVGELESAVGVSLVDRHGRGVSVNTQGQRLARGARLAIAEISAILIELGLHPSGTLIGLGTTPAARAFLVPEAMAKMTGEAARASFRVFEGSWAELVEPLRDGVLDLIVGELRDYAISDLLQVPLFDDRLIVVGGSHHPLARVASPSFDQLASYPWIVGLPNSPTRAVWEHLFAARGLPSAPIECGSVMITGRLLTNGNYLTLLSPDEAALQIRSGLLAQVGKPLSGTTSSIGITARASWRPTSVQQRFLDLLREVSAHAGRTPSRAGRLVAEWV